MAQDGGTPLPETDSLTPELAPFVVQARALFEQATDGLDHDAAIEHLEAAVAHAEAQASRLGFSLPVPEPVADALALGDGSVVLVQRVGDPGQQA
jgi:hypothetical protein